MENPALLLQTALRSKKILLPKQHQQFISTTEELPLTNIEVALVICVLVSYLIHFQNKQHLLSCRQKEPNSTALVYWSFAPSLSFESAYAFLGPSFLAQPAPQSLNPHKTFTYVVEMLYMNETQNKIPANHCQDSTRS